MKKYIRNKNFVPKNFYNLKVKKEEESIKKIKFLFIILNLIFLPITLNNIRIYKDNKDKILNEVNINEYRIKKVGINCNDITCWIDNIFLDGVESASVDKSGGEIILNDMKALNFIDNNINIKNINNDNNNYILGVELNNEKK